MAPHTCRAREAAFLLGLTTKLSEQGLIMRLLLRHRFIRMPYTIVPRMSRRLSALEATMAERPLARVCRFITLPSAPVFTVTSRWRRTDLLTCRTGVAA